MSTRPPSTAQTQPTGRDASSEANNIAGEVETEFVVDHSSEKNVAVDSPLGPDHVFKMLKNQRRRRTLRYLLEHNDSVTIGTLAEHIAALEHDTTESELTWRERKRVYIGLYQFHLPKLDGVDAITFEKARGNVAPGPATEQFRPYLELEPHEEADWSSYYVGLAGLSGLALVSQAMNVWSGLSLALLLVGILCGFALLSIVHLCTELEIDLSHLPALNKH